MNVFMVSSKYYCRKKMPRDARVIVLGVPYHVTQRGNYRQVVFDDDSDKEKYMEFFMLYKEEFGVKLYAWCLMSNHVHFIVEPSTENGLAELFKFTHMRYSQYFNRKRGAFGHLWQGRFFSCALDNDYLYEAIRYVELNPLRAGMISKIDAYKWSSTKERLKINSKGKGQLDSIEQYLQIDDWKEYLKEKGDEDFLNNIRNKTKLGKPLGDTKFIKRMEKLSGKEFTFRKSGRPKKEKK